MDKTIYDISQYNDQELYRMLDLDHPTDRELEAKIIVLIQKYQEMDNPMGRQMYQFFNDIYHHFFEDDEEVEEVEEVASALLTRSETPLWGSQPLSTFGALRKVTEGFENPTATPPNSSGDLRSPSELVIGRPSALRPIIQTSGNWSGAELDILPDSEVSRGTAITASPSQKAGVASENTVKVGINTNYGSSIKNQQIGYQKSLDYTKGSLNPIIKETIQRVISIDSQFRDVNVYPYSTDFTFNLSDTLQNVVSLKLYSVQIPFTWYTVSNAYGSNFFYLTGNSAGIKGTGYYDISINIPSGNYQASDLVKTLGNAFKTSIKAFPDINFGPTTEISYDSINSRATITLDIQQIYNESCYYLEFPKYDPPQITQYFINYTSTPYMKFQCIHNYYSNVFNDISLVVPPPIQDSSNNQNINVTSYGYNVSSYFSTVYTLFHTPVPNQHKSVYNFSSSTINTTDISKNLILNFKFNYRIPAYYYNGTTNINNFTYNFVSYNNNDYNSQVQWSDSPWHNMFDSVINFAVNSNITSIVSKYIPYLNINSTNSNLLTLIGGSDGSANLYNRLNTSWYDTDNKCFVDQSYNKYVIPNNYFYDVHSLVIKITSNGFDNTDVPPVTIPVILNGDGLNDGDSTSGISIQPYEFTNLLNKTLTNNASQLAKNYRIYINPTPFTHNSGIITFDTSISAILTEKDYKVSFYDTNGYPEGTQNEWANIQNSWSNYLSIPYPSYDLSNSNSDISGDKPFVDPLSTLTDQIFPTLDNYSLQSFLGYQDVCYNLATWTSKPFLGSEYTSNLQFPTVDISSIFLDVSGSRSSVFDIYLYRSNITDTNFNKTTSDYSTSGGTDSSYSIMYSGLSNTSARYTFQQIITSINTSLQSYGIFTTDTGISIINSSVVATKDSSNSVITTDQTIYDFESYYYQLKIQFDRKKSRNDTNMKTYIKIHDSNTLLTNLKFNIPVTKSSNEIELCEIVSENKILSNTCNVTTHPYVYLRCITPGYSGFSDNDTSFTIPQPPNVTNIGYTIPQYLNTIQTNMMDTVNTAWGLSGFADLNYSNSMFRMGINIKHIIPATDKNGQGNFIIDFSESILKQMNPSLSWIIDSSNDTFTFDNLVFSSQTYNVKKGDSDKIKIILKGHSQGTTGAYKYTDTDEFTTYFYIPEKSYSLYQLVSYINTVVFGLSKISDSCYNTLDDMGEPSDTYIPNGRVNMYGSSMTANINQMDITKNNIVFKISIRSILTYKDYHLEFYDPIYYQQKQMFGPGLKNTTDRADWDHADFVYYNVMTTHTNYMKTDGIWNNDISNSWYRYLHISDPSYLLINQPLVTQQNMTYALIYGTKTITDQQLYLTSDNNYFTIKPNVDERGGVFVKNPSDYLGIYSYANDIVVKLDLSLNTFYHSDVIVNEFNNQLTNNPVTYGSYISIDPKTHSTIIRLNMNKIFTAEDYAITFYEPNLFTHCSYGSHPSIQTTTQDTTLGWLLGFRHLPIYNLDRYWVNEYNGVGTNQYSIIYTCDSNNIVSITGDTSVSITLYNYFLIILDDYTQNHLNDGLVTVNSPFADISLPSYANRNTHRCNLALSQNNNPKDTTYIGNSRDPTTNNNLTLKQLYSANQILNTQQTNAQTYQTNMGIYVQDVFGIIPVKTSGLINGQTYVEFGGTLQNQDRMYFGPVNIKRMAVRILTDKGNILDLNNANISFSLIAQQLYNPYARG